MRLAAAGLAIGKDGPVVAANSGLDQRESCFIVDLPLGGVDAVDGVVREHLLLRPSFFAGPHDDLIRGLVNAANALAA